MIDCVYVRMDTNGWDDGVHCSETTSDILVLPAEQMQPGHNQTVLAFIGTHCDINPDLTV